ncbi:hypothetical protein [Nonomuraea phyllanthi]|uniref:hypothetical protein n=1 Tax=Nonomuraea phyllanthi TaxID=2219224 RepID=UPI0012936177|nr:hypothetical protein [Nonomuraea phyllanthi]
MKPLSTIVKAALIGPAIAIGTLAGLAPIASAATTSVDHAAKADVSQVRQHGHHPLDPRWGTDDPRWDAHQGNRYDPRWGYWRHDPRLGYWHFDPTTGRYRWDRHWDRRWDHRWNHRWGHHLGHRWGHR